MKKLGNCRRCGAEIMSVRDRKDHTVGEPKKSGLARYKSGSLL